jgi:hypothetical protein
VSDAARPPLVFVVKCAYCGAGVDAIPIEVAKGITWAEADCWAYLAQLDHAKTCPARRRP